MGVDYFFPQLDCVFKDDFCHIISAKKQVSPYFEYSITCTRFDFDISSRGYVGRIIGNFLNDTFNTFLKTGNGSPEQIILTTRYLEED